MPNPNHNPSVLAALDSALTALKERNSNPLSDSPLFAYKDKIAALLNERATNATIAEVFTTAGLEVSATTVARFIRDAGLRRKRRGTRKKPAALAR